MQNPKAALDVLNAAGETVGKIQLSEITLAKAAILDRIKSPLVTGKKLKEVNLDDVIPTLFVLATSAADSRKLIAQDKFDAAVLDWSDSIAFADGILMFEALKRIASRLNGVAPEGMTGEAVPGDDQKKQRRLDSRPCRHDQHELRVAVGSDPGNPGGDADADVAADHDE
jgi:hypothetical protein